MGRRIDRLAIVAGAALIACAPAGAIAALGDGLFATGGPIVATFEGSSAAFGSSLQLVAPSIGYESGFVFPNHSTATGSTFTFLPDVAAGTRLNFRIRTNENGETWAIGPGANNADGIAHADVISNWNGTARTFVGFEDVRGGGDRDFNDFTVSISNVATTPPVVTAVPEPETYAMLLAGLGLLGFFTRRKK